MPWYKAGTVSVVQNSNAVTGSGTSFIANSRVGDAFRGPDGGWYEVTNIASDTAMSISPPYQGANAAAGAYALAPMQGYVKDSADALRALVNQFGSVLAVLGTVGTLAGVRSALNLTDTTGLPEGTNKYFTDARVRAVALTGLVLTDASAVVAADAVLAAFGKLQAQATAASSSISGKAAKGANNDITSLSALTTALSVAQGGTGFTTLAALLTALNAIGNYAKANVLGTVSVSGGVPTGAIFETNSNANGTYIKHTDGTLICRFGIALPVMGVGAAVAVAWTFPAVFTLQPTVTGMAGSQAGNSGFLNVGIDGAPSATGVTFAAGNSSGTTLSSAYIHVEAIGRWY